MLNSRKTAKTFLGLNNVEDPQRLGMRWLTRADNVDITMSSAVVRARGFTQASTNFAITGAYATKDLLRLYVVDSGELRQMNADVSTYQVLRSGLSARSMRFDEVNGVVYYTNGAEFGIIEPGGHRPWGIPPPPTPGVAVAAGALHAGLYLVACTQVDDRGMESANSEVREILVPEDGGITISGITAAAGYTANVYVTDANGTVFFRVAQSAPSSVHWRGGALGPEIPFWGLDLPRGTYPKAFQGRMHVAEWFPANDFTVLWASLPLQFHHFDYGQLGVTLPGEIRMMEALPDGSALIIGTDRAVLAYDGEKLETLAQYGVTSGFHASVLEDQLYFWSLRGLCRAMPFANLTAGTVSVPPGSSAGAMVLEKDGMRRYVVALKTGGSAYNRRTS